MATVYLAEDLKHARRVAIKVLLPELGAVVGAERFLTEIRLMANLQHPNILPLYDSGATDGLVYYVMPYVEGETLRARMTREQQLPIADVVHIAATVANALDYAHRRGVIHRDIKPENILLTDAEPIVADFGVARAVSNAAGERITQSGIAVGTPQYMSPEQASAERTLDGRTDIYSLGAVTYEMLTGEPPFTGPNASAIIAKVMTDSVSDVSLRRQTVPPILAAAVHRALERVPADRFGTAAEFGHRMASAMTDVGDLPSRSRLRVRSPTSSRAALWIGGIIAVSILAGALIASLVSPTSHVDVVRASILLPETPVDGGGQNPHMAISRDGRLIAYAQRAGIAIRQMDSAQARVLPGTAGAQELVFSPDGKSMAFVVAGHVKRVLVSGGPPTEIAQLTYPYGRLVWERDGYIYASVNSIWRVSANGGAPQRLTQVQGAEEMHVGPQLLPGGRALLFTAMGVSGGSADSRIVAERLESHERVVLVEHAIGGRYLPTGHLLYANNDGVLFAARMNAAKLSLVGQSEPVLSGVETSTSVANAFYDVADDGTLIYLPRDLRPYSNLEIVDRSGRLIRVLGGDSASDVREQPSVGWPAWSPDGSRIAFEGAMRGATDIWILDPRSGRKERFTFHPGEEESPRWSPDGRLIAYRLTDQGARSRIMVKAATGGENPRAVYAANHHMHLTAWSPDGKWIAIDDYTSTRGLDVRVIPVDGGESVLVSGTAANERSASWSPDGRYLVYTSDENGQPQLYAMTFPHLGAKIQVSEDRVGGALWDRTGTLYYATRNQAGAQRVDTRNGWHAEPWTPLFPYPGGFYPSPDGQRFAILRNARAAEPVSLQLVVNWFDELRKKMETRSSR